MPQLTPCIKFSDHKKRRETQAGDLENLGRSRQLEFAGKRVGEKRAVWRIENCTGKAPEICRGFLSSHQLSNDKSMCEELPGAGKEPQRVQRELLEHRIVCAPTSQSGKPIINRASGRVLS